MHAKGLYNKTRFLEGLLEWDSQKAWQKVLRRVLRTRLVAKENGSHKGFLQGVVSRRCLERSFGEYDP